jgi:glycosyltransferase involved in cell wall biosynthesis
MEDKKIKIFYLIASCEIGGTERMLYLLAKGLDRKIYEPVITVLSGSGEFTEQLRQTDFRLYVLNLRKAPLSVIKLFQLIKKESPDILHSFLFAGNLLGRIFGKIAGVPVVISAQRSVDAWRKWYHWILDRITSCLPDIIISNSFAGKKILTEKSRINPNRIIVISNGIKSEPEAKEVSRKTLGIEGNCPVVGTVGNLRKAKGHVFLIKAASKVIEKMPEVKFVIVGQGELRNSLEEKTEQEKIEDNFIFPGFIQNARDIMRIFDVFVFPSLWEGCPVSLLEAMDEGKPVVAFSVGDIPFIIKDGENGFLAEPRDYRTLSRKILQLLADGKLRSKLGDNARKTVREKFTLAEMIEKHSALYQKLLDRKKKRR